MRNERAIKTKPRSFCDEKLFEKRIRNWYGYFKTFCVVPGYRVVQKKSPCLKIPAPSGAYAEPITESPSSIPRTYRQFFLSALLT